MEEFVAVIAVLYLSLCVIALSAVLVVQLAYVIVTYILEGKSLSAIARRRGIEKPWLAWVPVGKFWLLGCISDQYRYVVHGQVRNRRKLLLWLDIVLVAVSSIFSVGMEIWAVATIWSAVHSPEAAMVSYMAGVAVIYLALFVFIAIAAIVSVFQYMAYFDLFRSSDPKKSLPYLLVSIFATYPLPFFVYSCRNKDLGMPPRTDEPLPEGPCV